MFQPRAALSTLCLFALTSLTACKFPYPPDIDDGDASAACMPSTTTCTGSTLAVCDADGHPSSTTACAFGCFADEDRCADLKPSNGLAAYLDQARTAAPLRLTEPAILDTDTAQLTTTVNVPITTAVIVGGPTDVLVVMTASFEAGDVRVIGTRALAIASDGDVELHGHLSVSAPGAVAGLTPTATPGASAENDPGCTASRGAFDATGYSGAGGGGHGSVGGRGGSGNGLARGARGDTAGNEALVPLRGGCPGLQAWGMMGALGAPRGGGGGGAIQIATRGRIVLDATAAISANGDGAVGPLRACPFMPGDPPGCHAGSGGGAGGGILLEARRLEVPASAGLVANGGGGTCQLHGGGDSGARSEEAAAGQNCSTTPENGSGGDGGASMVTGTDGGDGTITGGGGGGGAGRIRINLPAGITFDPVPPIVSPMPSLAAAGTR